MRFDMSVLNLVKGLMLRQACPVEGLSTNTPP